MTMSELPPRPGAPEPPAIAVDIDPTLPPLPPPPLGRPPWGASKPPSSPAYRYADYSKRALAWFVDGAFLLLWTVPAWVILFLGPTERYTCRDSGEPSQVVDCGTGPSVSTLLLFAGLLLLDLAGAVAYRVLLEGGPTGQTLGKRLAGIRVVHESGEPLGYGRALGRVVVQLAAWGVCFGVVLDYLWPVWDDRRQALHDKVVDSVVIEA